MRAIYKYAPSIAPGMLFFPAIETGNPSVIAAMIVMLVWGIVRPAAIERERRQ